MYYWFTSHGHGVLNVNSVSHLADFGEESEMRCIIDRE